MSDNLVDQILAHLKEQSKPVSTLELARHFNVDHQQAVGAIKSIVAQTSASFLGVEQKECKGLELTSEGQIILQHGSHEARVFRLVQEATKQNDGEGLEQEKLTKSFPDPTMAKLGFAKAMQNKWIKIDDKTKKLTTREDEIQDTVHELIKSISNLSLTDSGGDPSANNKQDSNSSKILSDTKTINDLKKRKLVVENVIKYMIVEKGPEFSLTIDKPETDLTTNLLQSGDWSGKKFKDYNFNALGQPTERGHLHPLLKVREQFRQIFLEMGFAEMPTNNFVESSFWNFDTLVVPQAHPARDSQDTFFMSQPEFCNPIEDAGLVERVRQAHHGSDDGKWPKGYQYEWNEKESKRNVLRTHTTAVTARMLYKLAEEFKKQKQQQQQQPKSSSNALRFKPIKFFSIDRVFRNETLDATHLAEFNQVEGVCVDEGLTLGDLMGVLEAFFEKLGIKQLRFKPAYNPYTEPSMEIFSFHSGLNKWVEVGNSGVFRPEMLDALGLPESVSAIAWGLSLERPTMIKYKIDNIRELVGHKVNLQMVQESPLCLF